MDFFISSSILASGRAGIKGTAYTLVTDKDKEFVGHVVRNLEAANQEVSKELMDLVRIIFTDWIVPCVIRFKNAMLPNFSKNCPKVATAVLPLRVVYFKVAPNIWATFVRKFVAENFIKSPNLVALILPY